MSEKKIKRTKEKPEEREKWFAAIDLKSFYASVECVERGLDPLTTNLVVADFTRTDGTICLAVSPSLKELGLPGRCRLFEVKEKAREYRYETGKELEYIVAPPQMKKYLEYSRKIYQKVFLEAVAEEDIFRYSIDEVFMDISSYLKYSEKTPEDFVRGILRQIYRKTRLTATAGVGTNLYLAKVGMDILAKKKKPDRYGARIAVLDEEKFKKELWGHKPLTDFWRIGRATARKLEKFNLYTMGDLARVAIKDEEFFYKMFGVDAELFIDHIWGVEPVGMRDVKNYKPVSNSLSSGQVLGETVFYRVGRLLVAEMMEDLSLKMVEKGMETDLLTLDLVYDDKERSHGSCHPLDGKGEIAFSSSGKVLIKRATEMFDRIVDPRKKIKRIYLSAGDLVKAGEGRKILKKNEQLRLGEKPENGKTETDTKLTEAMLTIKRRYGANSISRAMSFEEGANGRKRNRMIGGHNA